MMIDPLADMQVEVQNYDIERIASVYFDRSGQRAWTKAWFNHRDQGEKAIEISRDQAIKYRKDMISRDDWLAHYFPRQMSACQQAVAQVRQQLLNF